MSSGSGSRSATSSSSPQPDNVIKVPDPTFPLEPQQAYDYHSLDGKDPVICIDPGRFRLKG